MRHCTGCALGSPGSCAKKAKINLFVSPSNSSHFLNCEPLRVLVAVHRNWHRRTGKRSGFSWLGSVRVETLLESKNQTQKNTLLQLSSSLGTYLNCSRTTADSKTRSHSAWLRSTPSLVELIALSQLILTRTTRSTSSFLLGSAATLPRLPWVAMWDRLAPFQMADQLLSMV